MWKMNEQDPWVSFGTFEHIVALKFAFNGVYLFGGSDKGNLNLWDTQTGALIETV